MRTLALQVFVYEALGPDDVCSLSSLRGRLVPSHTLHTEFGDLEPGTTHLFRIRCKNACGWSEDSDINPVSLLWREHERALAIILLVLFF